MGIEFNILWFEDNEDWLNSIKSDVEERITNRHFIPKIECFPRAIQLEKLEYLKDKMHTFHLILTDLKLDNGLTGDEIIEFFRENNILADVLFYSGDGVARIKEVMQHSVLEGVYTAEREDTPFLKKLEKLIDKTVVRFETPSSMRNHLINYVAENDLIMKEFIKKSINCEKTNRYTCRILNESLKDSTERIEKIIKKKCEKNKKNCDNKCDEDCHNYLKYSLDKIGILDSEKLSKLFNKVLKIKNISGLFTHQEYKDNILQIRNEFAHDSHKVCTAKECTDIRKNMIEYSKIISGIKK